MGHETDENELPLYFKAEENVDKKQGMSSSILVSLLRNTSPVNCQVY